MRKTEPVGDVHEKMYYKELAYVIVGASLAREDHREAPAGVLRQREVKLLPTGTLSSSSGKSQLLVRPFNG